MDEMIRNEDSQLQENGGSIDERLGPITDSIAYEIDEQSLACPDLEENPIYIKLKKRLLKFFVTREEARRYGPSKKQLAINKKAGVD